MNVADFLSLKRCQAVVPTPDQTAVIVVVQRTDDAGARFVADLWRVPVDGGPPVRLTRGDDGATSPCFRRDGGLAFLSKRPGPGEDRDEAVAQVWLLPAGGGEAYALTDEPLGVLAFTLAGDTLATLAPVLPGVPHDQQAATRKDRRKNGPSALRFDRMPVRFWDHWIDPAEPHLVVRRADGSERRDLLPDVGQALRETSWDLAPDGARVVVVRLRTGPDRIRDGVLVEIDIATGRETVLSDEPRTAWYGPRFSPDGRTIAAVRSERFADRPPLDEVWRVGEGRVALPDTFAPSGLAWRGDGTLCIAGGRNGRCPVLDASGATLLDDAGFEALASQPGDPRLYGLRSTLLDPPEPFVAEGRSWRTLARLSGAPPADDLVVDELTVSGADGVPVHALVVAPRGKGPHPALLWIHGGPIGAHAHAWHWRWNARLAAEQGYVVCLPNPRGSTGYGAAFVAGIWGNTWGGPCYDDLMAVTNALCARPDVDAGRVAAMGGSFGGYMVNWIGGTTDRFRALVSHASVYDFGAFQGTTDEPNWWRLELGVTTWSDGPALARYSPSRVVPRWKTPVLVLHGEKDFRCPVSEGLALFDALQLHGVPSELVVFPDENHWILKPRNIRAWNEAWMGFVARHVG